MYPDVMAVRQTIKLIEWDVEISLYDLWLSIDQLDITPKAHGQMKTQVNWIKNFMYKRFYEEKVKVQPTEMKIL